MRHFVQSLVFSRRRILPSPLLTLCSLMGRCPSTQECPHGRADARDVSLIQRPHCKRASGYKGGGPVRMPTLRYCAACLKFCAEQRTVVAGGAFVQQEQDSTSQRCR